MRQSSSVIFSCSFIIIIEVGTRTRIHTRHNENQPLLMIFMKLLVDISSRITGRNLKGDIDHVKVCVILVMKNPF